MAITYKDINQLSQKSQVAGTEKIPVSDTQYITPNQIAALAPGGDTSSCVHKTGDESIGGDKTFTDNIGVVDADHIVYSGGGGGGGFTRGTTDIYMDEAVQTVDCAVSGEPKAFMCIISSGLGSNVSGVLAVVGDSTGCHGIYTTGTQHNYSTGFSFSYSGGYLYITAPSGVVFADASYHLLYYYGSGTLIFKTSQIQPGSGITAVTFTGTPLTEMPAIWTVLLETQVNSESYRRVACASYETSDGIYAAKTFYSSQVADTTNSFTSSYSNGLYINSGGTNAGGYFHNPGTYTLYYLMDSDVAGGGSGGFQSLGDELDDIRDTISGIETLLAAI